jgi:hypothetical protein
MVPLKRQNNKENKMKHVGKMKNNDAPVVIVFRTIPGDPHNCLVVGTQGLGPTHHDALMTEIQTPESQGAFELATILATRRFPDNSEMLAWLHFNKKLRKIATKDVIVTPTPSQSISLDELNKLIAEQKGISLEELAGGKKTDITEIAQITETPVANIAGEVEVLDDTKLAKSLRSQADALFKEAQTLRKQADDLDPPKKKTAKAVEA